MNDKSDATNEVPEPKPAPTPYLRLPWYVVTAAIVILLGGLLALGLYANRNLRQQPIAAPPPPTAPITTVATPVTGVETPAAPVALTPTIGPAAPTQAAPRPIPASILARTTSIRASRPRQ